MLTLATRRPGTERDAFWHTYGPLATTPGAALRSLYYRARHLAGARLEMHRLGNPTDLPATYHDMRDILVALAS